MGSADCLYYAGLVKTPEKLFKRKLGPLPDTLQAGACVFPPFQISRDHVQGYTKKNKCWIYVYFTHRFNAQTNYLLHAMCKMPLVQQVANSHCGNVFLSSCIKYKFILC